MNYFLAVNDRQLGTCLRMLFAEKLQLILNVKKRFVKPGNTTNRKNNILCKS